MYLRETKLASYICLWVTKKLHSNYMRTMYVEENRSPYLKCKLHTSHWNPVANSIPRLFLHDSKEQIAILVWRFIITKWYCIIIHIFLIEFTLVNINPLMLTMNLKWLVRSLEYFIFLAYGTNRILRSGFFGSNCQKIKKRYYDC